jgi:probable F420-dependent oxidoreductase
MQTGVIFPQTEIGPDPAGVRAYAQAVQDIGFQHLEVFDHVLGADPAGHPGFEGPYNVNSQFHEPFVVFGYLAAVAPKLELVTSVIILPQRQAALVAKQAAAVDVLTGGKLRLGVGIGWNAVEYEALDMDFRNRGRRFEEQIELMRRLWTERSVTFEGKYHRVTAAGINPLPVQRPIPVWIGASAEPAIKRAAELGDGYFPQRPLAGGWPATFEKIHGWLRAAGREPSTFGIDARVQAGVGTPDEWRQQAEQWRKLGATHLSINTMNGGLRGPDAHVERLREALQAVEP